MNKFFENTQIINKIVLVTLVPAGAGSAVHKNRPSHGLALNLEGEKIYTFDSGEILTVKKNDLIYLPKGSNYQIKSPIHGKIYCINFQLESEELFSPFALRLSNPDEILNCYQTAEKAWTRLKDGRDYKVLSLLYKIYYELKLLQVAPYVPKHKNLILQPAIDYIHKNYTNELINVKEVSEKCGISYDYLRKLFNKFYGCSPIKYINNLKIKRAKELLASGLYSVTETAFQSGFSDASHFCRFFKENVGVLPSEYTKQ